MPTGLHMAPDYKGAFKKSQLVAGRFILKMK